MRHKISIAVIATGLLFATYDDASAHGGSYRGPTDTVPPNLGGGGDTTPPGNPGGPVGTPGPGGSTGGARGPTTGGGPGGIPGGATGTAGRGRTGGGFGGRNRGPTSGYDRWEFWWENNDDPFLNLKARLDGRVVFSNTAGFFTGRGRREDAISTNRPRAEDVRRDILPLMTSLLEEKHADVVDSACIAIGRMVRPEDADLAIEPLIKTLAHGEKTARQAATLALGILGSPLAIDPLLEILQDSVVGRKLTGHPEGVEDLVRAFAAASLGLIGDSDPRVIDGLKSVISDNNLRSNRDVKALAILSLGMMPVSAHEEIVPFLLGLIESRNMDRIVRAQAPIALSRLHSLHAGGSRRAVMSLTKLVNAFDDDKTDNDLRRSLAVAMGVLAGIEDREVVSSLQQAAERDTDAQVRHFAIMALADIGFRDAHPADNADLHQQMEGFLTQQLRRPKHISNVPFGALGLAVYSRGEKLNAANRAGQQLLHVFEDSNNPTNKGAFAIAMGILNYKNAQETLWNEFLDSRDNPMKGYIAVSLGLMRASTKAEYLRQLIAKPGLDNKFRLQLARALGLMSDTQSIAGLVAYLQSADTIAESGSAAQALGLIGDRSAIQPLLTVAGDSRCQELQRGFAAVALGLLAEKSDLPWNTVFACNSNYRARVPALAEILDIL